MRMQRCGEGRRAGSRRQAGCIETNVKKKVDFSSALLSIAIIVVMILLLINPTRYAISVTNGLKLFFTAVLRADLKARFL